jgi:hypothetical protein
MEMPQWNPMYNCDILIKNIKKNISCRMTSVGPPGLPQER